MIFTAFTQVGSSLIAQAGPAPARGGRGPVPGSSTGTGGLNLGGSGIEGVGIGETSRFIGDPLGYFTSQLSNVIGFITLVGALFFLVYLVLAGFEWLQAGGDSGKTEKAKNRMTNGAIGLLIMILATAIAGIVGGAFGIDILNPQTVFNNLF